MTQKSQQKWKIGTLCEVFSNSKQEWFNGKIVHRVQNYKGKWVKVKFGPGLMFEKLLPMNSADLRSCQNLSVQQSMQKQNSEEQLLTNIYDQLTSDNNNTKEYHCRKCGYINHTDSVNCNSCGQSLNECAHCTHVNDMDALVCALCHRSLSSYSRKLPPSRMKNANNIDVHKNIQLSIHGASYKLINFSLNWQHISNAIKHELYDTIASSFMDVVKNNKKEYSLLTYDNINYVLDTLKVVKNIKPNEIYYINQLINSRAKQFKPLKNTTDQSVMDDREYDETMTQFNGCIHTDFPDLNIQLLYDIYNVHNYILFVEYQFQQYDEIMLEHQIHMKNLIPNNKHFDLNEVPKINLYPKYIINDNMYDIWNYFFDTSHLVHKLRQIHDDFTLKITVIPKNVISVSDKHMFSYHTEDIDIYLETETPTSFEQVCRQLSNETPQQIKIIVDRRQSDQNHEDKIYIPSHDTLEEVFHELDKNYFMSLLFTVSSANINDYSNTNIVRCHLFYGLGSMQRMRFYPEHLTSILPRFFVKNGKLNYYEAVNKLYNDQYKHGFAVSLNDPIFNRYYKIMTKWTHVSVNYNRNIVNVDEKSDSKYEYEDIECKKRCNFEKRLTIDECPLIQYIFDSLITFKNANYQVHSLNKSKFNLLYLSKCYNHIICVHLFCMKSIERMKITNYVSKRIGKCQYGSNCASVHQHSSRARESKSILKQYSHQTDSNNQTNSAILKEL
eukprot:400054_1